MSRTTLITTIVIIIFAIIVAGMVWYFSSLAQRSTPPGVEPGGSGFFSRLFPGASTPDDSPRRPDDSQSTTTPQPAARLQLVSNEPVAGGVVFEREVDEEREQVIRYMERATSHVFETPAALTNATKRLTNTTLPAVQRAIFSSDGQSVTLQYLDDNDTVQTFEAVIAGADEEDNESFAQIDGSFLPSDISSLSVSRSGSAVAYLLSRTNGSSTFISENGEQDRVLSSPVSEWNIEWSTDSEILFTTKPSHESFGYAYILTLASGAFERLAGRIVGLNATLSPDGKTLLYSQSTDDGFEMLALNTANGEKNALPFASFAEKKCVWSNTESTVAYCGVPNIIPPGDYPDVWYQGRVHFSDDIWRINVASQSATYIVSLEEESGQEIDAINLSLSPDDSYLLFMNKRDLRLWSLQL